MKRILLLFFLAVLSVGLYSQQNNEINIGTAVTVKSAVLGEERQILVSLPAGYVNGSGKYPVLYLFDGNAHFNYASGLVNYLSATGRIPQMIVVAIPNANRNRDFSPTRFTNNDNSGGGDKFLDFLEQELLPYIEANYRTQPYRIVFGHSLTGMFSLYSFLSRPDIFNAYLMASPYVIYDNNYIVARTSAGIKKKYDKLKFLYFTVGNEPEYFAGLDSIMQAFKAAQPVNLKWNYVQHKEYDHGTIPINTIYDGLLGIYKEWALPADFPQAGTLEMLLSHYSGLSKKFGYEILPAEALVNITGYQVMGAGRIQAALDFFRYNVDKFPGSANVFDSYGEGLEQAGQFAEAHKYYLKALKLGEENNDPNVEAFRGHVTAIEKNHADLIE